MPPLSGKALGMVKSVSATFSGGGLHHMTYQKLTIKTNLSVTVKLVPGTKNDSLSTHGIMGVTSVLLTVEMFSTPSRLLPPSHTFLVQNRSPASEWVEHCCGLGSRQIHNSLRMFGGACTDRMGLSWVFPLSVNSDATFDAPVKGCAAPAPGCSAPVSPPGGSVGVRCVSFYYCCYRCIKASSAINVLFSILLFKMWEVRCILMYVVPNMHKYIME